MQKQKDIRKITKTVILAMLTAIMIILSFTPLGYAKFGIIEATLHVIPMALGAVVLGPAGGAFIGAVFGITSFMTCFGFGMPSAFGAMLLSINPFFAFTVCFVPRVLAGLFAGLANKALRKKISFELSSIVTGFLSAAFNTVLFLSTLMLLFGNTDQMQELIAGRNIILFMCVFAGFGALIEMALSPVVTGALSTALYKAKLIK